ncbi:MAG: presqualene diphosphate synthase HpnD [Rhodospirillales bacterium]|jgi:presqualene diphosphate synthase|nr:presqualene diphosphate synthase HpnD [Rhodospirillales bacterium]
MMTPDQERLFVRDAVRKSGTSFYWAMRMLSPEKRHAMYSIYAFCRVVDDIADEPDSIDHKRLLLDEWRKEIPRIFAEKATVSLGHVLQEPVKQFKLQIEDFYAIIDGMQSDATADVRILNLDDLGIYMDQVACSVGRLSTRVFGIDPPLGTDIAKALGEALQLTNILRDVQEDALHNRLYLPVDLLREQGLECAQNSEISLLLKNPAISKVCSQLRAMAAIRYEQAETLLSQCDRGHARPAIMMMALYKKLFLKLPDQNWTFPRPRVSLSSPEKMWILLRHGFC